MMILTLGPGDLSAKIKIATLIIYSRRLLNGRARCLGNRKKEMKTKKKGKKKETTTTIQRAPLWTRDPPIFFSVRRRRPIIFPPDGQSQPPTREACLAIWIIPMRVQVEEEEKSDISPLLLADNEDSDNDSHWLVNCHSISSSDWKTFTSRQWKAPAKSSFSPAFTRIVFFFPSSFLLQDFLCLWTMIVWIYRLLRHDNPSRIPVFSLFYFPTGSIWKEVRSILFSDFNPVRSMNSPEFGHIGIRFFSFFCTTHEECRMIILPVRRRYCDERKAASKPNCREWQSSRQSRVRGDWPERGHRVVVRRCTGFLRVLRYLRVLPTDRRRSARCPSATQRHTAN